MTPEREKLIRDTWASVRGWPVKGPYLNVAIRRPLNLRRLAPDDLIKPIDKAESQLTFFRGYEHSDEGIWERVYVECEGLRVLEHTVPAGTL